MSRIGKKSSLYAQVWRQQSQIFLVLFLFFVGLVVVGMFDSYRAKIEKSMDQNATIIELSLIPAIQFDDQEAIQECLETLAKDKMIERVILYDGSNNVMASVGKEIASHDQNGEHWNTYQLKHDIHEGGEKIATLKIQRSLKDFIDIIEKTSLALIVMLTIYLAIASYFQRRLQRLIGSSFKSLYDCVELLRSRGQVEVNELKGETIVEFHDFIDHFSALALDLKSKEESLKSMNEQLEERILQRTEEIKILHEKLVVEAHKAGMAELAAGIIHNFGNILNSLMMETHEMQKNFKQYYVNGHLDTLLALLKPSDMQALVNDPEKSAVFYEYVAEINLTLAASRNEFMEQLNRMLEQERVMNTMLKYQQNFVGEKEATQLLGLREIIEIAIRVNEASLKKAGVRVTVESFPTQRVRVQKSKLIHVLTNLFANSIDALLEKKKGDRRVHISFTEQDHTLKIHFKDNGIGIVDEHRKKLFTQGFTTKKDGHGFGLHSSANYMSDMNGNLELKTEQPEVGTVFIVEVPMESFASEKDSAA